MKKVPKISKENGRYFLTDLIREEVDFRSTQQSKGIPSPSFQKPVPVNSSIIQLPNKETWSIPPCDLQNAIANRESRRRFTSESFTLDELAFLLWSVQGIRAELHGASALRTVPSAGCRHPFETYLGIMRVEGINSAVYRYLPMDNSIVHIRDIENLPLRLSAATHGQNFTGQAAVTFIWTAIPERTEWRYAGGGKVLEIFRKRGHV